MGHTNPRSPNPHAAELPINGLKSLLTSATTLRVTHLSPSLKAPSTAHVLFSTGRAKNGQLQPPLTSITVSLVFPWYISTMEFHSSSCFIL